MNGETSRKVKSHRQASPLSDQRCLPEVSVSGLLCDDEAELRPVRSQAADLPVENEASSSLEAPLCLQQRLPI